MKAKSLSRVPPHGLQPTRLLRPWDFPGKSTGVGAIAFSENEDRVVKSAMLISAVIGISLKGPMNSKIISAPRVSERLELSWIQVPIIVSVDTHESWHLTLIVWPEHQEVSITQELISNGRVLRPVEPEPGFDSCVGKIPWRRARRPTLVFLPGESHGQRSLVGYSLWGLKELDTTEHTHIPFSSPQSIK